MIHNQRAALPINDLGVTKPAPEVANSFPCAVDLLAVAVGDWALLAVNLDSVSDGVALGGVILDLRCLVAVHLRGGALGLKLGLKLGHGLLLLSQLCGFGECSTKALVDAGKVRLELSYALFSGILLAIQAIHDIDSTGCYACWACLAGLREHYQRIRLGRCIHISLCREASAAHFDALILDVEPTNGPDSLLASRVVIGELGELINQRSTELLSIIECLAANLAGETASLDRGALGDCFIKS